MKFLLPCLLALALGACSSVTTRNAAQWPGAPIAIQNPAGAQRLVGTWHVEGTARFAIFRSNGGYFIRGWDRTDDEHFVLTHMRWDGRRLSGTMLMPSTHWTTISSLAFATPDQLRGPYAGDQKTGTEIWNRIKHPEAGN